MKIEEKFRSLFDGARVWGNEHGCQETKTLWYYSIIVFLVMYIGSTIFIISLCTSLIMTIRYVICPLNKLYLKFWIDLITIEYIRIHHLNVSFFS